MGVATAKCCERSAKCLESGGPFEGELIEAKSTRTPGVDSWGALGAKTIALPSGAFPDSQGTATGSDHKDAVLTFKDGSTYEGQFLNSKRHGDGTWKSSGGEYSGQWKVDQQDGEGQQRWQDGRVYIGQFAKGKFHGVGRMEWHTPQGLMTFEGQYVDDHKQGTGKFVWPDGRIYDGGWAEGKRWGQGDYYNSKGELKKGLWVNDKLERWLDPADQSPAAAL
jgi:hypothetical protein